MTIQEIKNLINTATTKEELQPLYDYHDDLKKKESKIARVLKVKEMQIDALAEIEKIKDITL